MLNNSYNMLVKPFSYLQQKITVGPVLPNIDTTGLLGWYDANSPGSSPSTTWEDLSGNGNNLTAVAGGVGSAPALTTLTGLSYYQFTGIYSNPGVSTTQTGGSYFTIATNPLGVTFDCTLTVWLYPDIDYSGAQTVGRWVSGGGSGGRMFFGSGFGSTNFGNGNSTYNPSPMTHPTLSTWQEYTVTFDNGSGASGVKFFKNASNYSSPSASNNTIVSGKPLHIGKQFDAANEYFNGRIAMVLIYDRALASFEVLNNYNAVKSVYGY